jgi:hypothetical protein
MARDNQNMRWVYLAWLKKSRWHLRQQIGTELPQEKLRRGWARFVIPHRRHGQA